MSERQRAEAIGAQYKAGQRVPMRDLAWTARYYPEYLQTPAVIRGEQQSGFKDMRSVGYAAREHPEMFQQPQIERRTVNTTPAFPTQQPRQEPQKTGMDYLLLPLPTVKQNAPIFSKGLTESVMDWAGGVKYTPLVYQVGLQPVPASPDFLGYLQGKPVERSLQQNIAGPLGVVAVGETFLESVRKTPLAPSPPPSGVGYVVEKGIETATGQPSERVAKAEQYGPSYVTAGFLGDYLVAAGISEVFPGMGKELREPVRSRAERYLTTKAIERGPLESASLTERFVGKVTGAKPYLSSQVVSVPTPEAVGLKGLEVQFGMWDIAESPRSSAVLFSKMPSDKLASAWAHEKLVKSVFGGLAYSTVKESLQKTSVQQMPFVGKTEVPPRSVSVFPLLLPKLKSEPSQKMPYLPTLTAPTRATRESNVSFVALTPFSIGAVDFDLMSESALDLDVMQGTQQALATQQVQVQMQKVLQQSKVPQMRLHVPKTDFSFSSDFTKDLFKLPKRRGQKRGAGLYLWEFPVKGARRALEALV